MSVRRIAATALCFAAPGLRLRGDGGRLAVFKSSPVGANGKLYLASEDEDVIVVRLGPMFEVLTTNTLHDQTFIATPAVVNGTIYLGGQNTLFAIP